MIRFVVYPGWISSARDRDRHWIDAQAVIRLHEVDPRECIVIDSRRPESRMGYSQEFIDKLLPLRPYKHRYSPVTPAERRAHPIPA